MSGRTLRVRRSRKGQVALVVTVVVLTALVSATSGVSGASAVAPSGYLVGGTGKAAPQSKPSAPDSPLTELSDGYGDTAAQEAAMQSARRKAQTTGHAQTVNVLTTETEQVLAQPSGGFALDENAEPVRTQEGGRWVAVDTRLHRTSAGSYSPAATAYGAVTLSGGGAGPLASTTSGGTKFAVSWPEKLPAPTISGSTATYRNVLPGVDLQADATVSGGFSEVLVVKTAQAAKNPKLDKLRLALSGTTGANLRADQQGQVVNVVSRKAATVLQADVPREWDSNTDAQATDDELHPVTQTAHSAAPRANPATAQVGPDRSDTSHPGLVARESFIPTTVGKDSLTLTPDANLLRNPATVYPVYIDPTFNWHPTTGGKPGFDEVKQGSPCNHVSLWNNTGSAGDNGQLGVGVNAWDGCTGIMRAYYQFKLPSSIWGAQINTATVNATEVYAASCSSTSTINLHWTSAIGSGTDWNNRPGFHSGFATSASYGPAYGSSCTHNGDVTHGFNVQSVIAKSASARDSSFTVALSEDSSESSHSSTGFKRFSDNPSLQIFFNRTPSTPAASALSATNGAENAGCDTSSPYPYIGKTIASNTTVLAAKISDPDGDALRATYKYWIDGSSTTATGLSGDNLASGSPAKFSLPSSFTSALTDGQIVDWQAEVTDGQATSGWSPTCHFTAEPTAPAQPTVTSADGKYPNTDAGGAIGSATGTAGSFTVSNTGTTATKFAYRLDLPPAASNPPASQLATATSNSATLSVTPVTPGPHTLWVYAIDAAGDSSSTAAYRFTSAAHAITTCASLSACVNNVAISPNATPSEGAADGSSSLSATDLTNAGWKSGGKVTVDGATFTLPAYGSGQKDNVVAANQKITLNQSIPSAGATALTFLTFATHANFSAPASVDGNITAPYIPGGTEVAGQYCFSTTDPSAYCSPQGTITYADGKSQPYYLVSPDWTAGPTDLAAVVLPHVNKTSGQDATHQPKIYPMTVPLLAGESGGTIASVTLPDMSSSSLDTSTPALHVMGLATRNTTTTSSPIASSETWTGAWANPSEGAYNYEGANFSNMTFRVALKPSISGNGIRIKLDNALGSASGPLNIGHATVALSSGGTSPSAVPTGTVTNLKFGGSAGVTIPVGGMAYSDPLSFAVTANKYLLVSFSLTNSVPYLVEHSWANTAYQYVSAPASGDHTADTTSTAFSGTNTHQGWFTDVLTDVDVSTNGVPTQAVLGDNLIDAWQPNTEPLGTTGVRLSDVLAADEPTTPSPYGTVAEGIESNQLATDDPETYNGNPVGGPSALSRIDRDILDQPGLTTVVVDEGLDDVLNGTSADTLTNGAVTELQAYLTANNITTIQVGLTPCDGYGGDGASSNDPCTSTVDGNRTDVNTFLGNVSAFATPPSFYIDPDVAIGTTNTADGLIRLDPNAEVADKVNLSNPGYAALATAFLGPQNTWQLDDGADDPTLTTASDTASNTDGAYLSGNPLAGTQPANLSATGATWATDNTRGGVLALDGKAGDATTGTAVLNTAGSYSVSAWVNLASASVTATVLAEQGTNTNAFDLRYDHSKNTWSFVTSLTNTSGSAQATALGTGAPTVNGWTHLVGTYNASTHAVTLYINGTSVGTATNATPWAATGSFDIGTAGTTAFLPGKVSDVQAWNYALSPTQVTALYQKIQ